MVTKDGTISRLTAAKGEISAPSTPIATVGNPMPVTPLTMPAAKKVAAAASRMGVDRSVMPLSYLLAPHRQCGSASVSLRLDRSLAPGYPAGMRFDLTDLRLFLAVAEAGSITHGAAEAGLSLPAASERLREMEASGRVRLLDRDRRGVTLTEAGEALLHHARLIMSQMARMHGEIGQIAKAVRGTVRLLANTAAMAEFLPARLAPWLATHPQADIVVKERQSADIARSIALGFAEIGVLSDLVETTGLTLRPFVTDRLVVVAGRDHALAAMRQVRFADLFGQPFIALSEGALQDHLDAQAARIGLRIRPRIRLRGFDDICRMASAGVGIGIIPETAARRCRKSMQISVKRLSDDWAVRRLSLCTRSDAELTPLAQSLLRHLESGEDARAF